jgi:hypothetical protein
MHEYVQNAKTPATTASNIGGSEANRELKA